MKDTNLYLLEVVINHVELLDETIKCFVPPLRVSIQFFDFPPFDIKQEEFTPAVSRERKGYFGNGKSLLFSMDGKDLIKKLKDKPLSVKVFRQDSSEAALGHTDIALDDIATSLEGSTNHQCSGSTANKYPLYDSGDIFRGFIAIFVRFSYYGQAIFTSFHFKKGANSFLFRSSKDESSFHLKKLSETTEFTVPYKISPVIYEMLQLSSSNKVIKELSDGKDIKSRPVTPKFYTFAEEMAIKVGEPNALLEFNDDRKLDTDTTHVPLSMKLKSQPVSSSLVYDTNINGDQLISKVNTSSETYNRIKSAPPGYIRQSKNKHEDPIISKLTDLLNLTAPTKSFKQKHVKDLKCKCNDKNPKNVREKHDKPLYFKNQRLF